VECVKNDAVVVTIVPRSELGVSCSCFCCTSKMVLPDNKGKQRLGFNDAAVRQPKPYGQEGRGVEVSSLVQKVIDVTKCLFRLKRLMST
jgi:hypothetical protein